MEMKNICGKIPLDLHEKVREEIERTESSTQKFILKVIEEHFSGKGEMNMEKRTLAVVAKKGCKQKDFLIAIIEQAIETAEAEWEQAQENAESGTETETGETEEESTPSEEMTDSESEVA